MRALLLAFAALTVWGGAPASAKPNPRERYRRVEVQLLEMDGKAAPGVKVDLFGVERDAGGTVRGKGEPPRGPSWHFMSDAHGRFTVELGKFRAYDSKEQEPGFGEFFLVAEWPGTAGAVSKCLWNPTPQETEEDNPANWESEWTEAPAWAKPRTLKLHDGVNEVTFSLERGVTVTGRLIDLQGKPIAGVQVALYHDLHYRSHTGYGGEFWNRSATSDDQGRFAFESVFPNTFYLSGPDDGCWMRTRVRDRWADERVDEIHVGEHEREIPIEIVMGPHHAYSFQGTVSDEEGKPLAKATVTVGLSWHRVIATHEDSHSSEQTTCDEAGHYTLRTNRQFVTWIQVKAPGFEPVAADFQEEPSTGLATPGEYSFTLQRAAAEQTNQP